ncbi:unnamed protein product [Linum tenue]|uniref:Uncharacterized protein n=1 Tax=Linum tenue TaxID=586396 RepID=A0AAV0KTS0_9ROSI|nr:unnamed protein product [Linum tenue]
MRGMAVQTIISALSYFSPSHLFLETKGRTRKGVAYSYRRHTPPAMTMTMTRLTLKSRRVLDLLSTTLDLLFREKERRDRQRRPDRGTVDEEKKGLAGLPVAKTEGKAARVI